MQNRSGTGRPVRTTGPADDRASNVRSRSLNIYADNKPHGTVGLGAGMTAAGAAWPQKCGGRICERISKPIRQASSSRIDGRTVWDASDREQAYVSVNTPATRAVWGLVGGRTFDLMVWNETRTSVGNQWGTGPAQVNGVAAQFEFPGRLRRIQPLDGRGQPQGEVPLSASANSTRFAIGPAHQPLWYAIEAD